MNKIIDEFKRRPTEPINKFTSGLNFEDNKNWGLIHHSVLKPLSSEGRLIWDIKPNEYPTKCVKRMGDGYQYKIGKNFPLTYDTVGTKRSKELLTPIS
jgi:hypothetical protein